MKFKNFSDIDSFLSSHRPDIKAVKWFFALEDMKDLMHELGEPQDRSKIIHVAGTSGKTSTAYYLAAMLKSCEKKVGLTVSPHVDSFKERVQIDGSQFSNEEYCKLFSEFTSIPAIKNRNITYFGLTVAFAYWVFVKKHVDYAVVEVGMGGRLDATNVINNPNKVCVITDIGLDHTQFLGEDLVSIAKEKAGIIQPSNNIFVAQQSSEVMEVFKVRAKQVNAKLHIMPNSQIDKSPSHLPLFQRRNYALVTFVFNYVAERDGLITATKMMADKIQVPARMESVAIGPKTIILDVSHNAQKITALCESLKQKYPNQKFSILMSLVEGKDTSLKASLKELSKICSELIVTSFSGSQDVYRKAIDPEIIATEANEIGIQTVNIVADPEKAYQKLLKQQNNLLLVTGSFFLLNHIRPLMKKEGLL